MRKHTSHNMLPPADSADSTVQVPLPSQAGWAPVFVWGIWALMLVFALAFVGTYGSNVPLWDEWWAIVPMLTGQEPLDTARWLWSLHNNHRMPVPKLLLLLFHTLGGYDFRVGMFFNVIAVAAMACMMILAARQMRGSTSYSDAFFPLVLLQWGHWLAFLTGFMLNFVSSTFLACSLLCIIACWGNQLTRKAIILAGVCLMPLPLVGANGLMLVPAFALWFLYAALREWRSQKSRGKGNALLLVGFVSITLIFSGLYFRHYDHYVAGSPSHWASLRVALQFLSMSFGAAASSFWPFSFPWLLVLFAISAVHLCRVWQRRPEDRPRALGFLLFMAAIVCTALAIGAGRAAWDHDRGLWPHYTILVAPALCALYFSWGIQNSWTKVVQTSLFLVVVIFFPVNTSAGLYAARQLSNRIDLFLQDAFAGTPIFILDERHGYFLNPWSGKMKVARGLEMLRRAQIGQFRNFQADPAFHEISVLNSPSVEPRNNDDLTFTLKQSQFVYAVRLKYSYEDPEKGPALFQVLWRNSNANNTTAAERHVRIQLQTGPGPGWWLPDLAIIPPPKPILEKEEIIWINDKIDRLRIDPDDKPRLFRVKEINLLLPLED
jgi:hypothetical protein